MTDKRPVGGDDRTIDMVLGLQTPEEEDKTLEMIAADGEAERDLVELVALRESARGKGAPSSSATGGERGGRFLRRRSPFPYLLAASVAMFILLRTFWIDGGAPPIAPLAVPSEANRLRGSEGIGGDLGRGLDAYESGDFEEAVKILSEAPAFGATETMRLIYLASAHNQSGSHEEAIAILETIEFETVPDPWGSEGVRNLIHAYRQTGLDAKADSLLRRYALREGEGDSPGGRGGK